VAAHRRERLIMNSYLETKIALHRIALISVGIFLAAAFTVGAFKTQQWGWLVALPMNILGIALVIVGGRTRRRTDGARGMAVSVLGGALIVGSIWSAFLLGDALSA
jgi:threonine/homoserine efflux transporter RhtA